MAARNGNIFSLLLKPDGYMLELSFEAPAKSVGLLIKVNDLSPNKYMAHKISNNKVTDNLVQIYFKTNQAPVLLDFSFVEDKTVNLPHDGDAETEWYTGDELVLPAFYFGLLDFDNE